ncbi:hypothetical protein B0I37DRAFT_347912 [Chaetomium sp. MPI-CAGE-AT-0009]|nr:hypothetical protein B0I37DRAFT_347912 [Chaetomium sp. MPI-CAGE-AT-0009]
MAPNILPFILIFLATTSTLATTLPRIQVTLTPHFSPTAPNTTTTNTTHTTAITALAITLHLTHPHPIPSHHPLLQLDLNHGLTPTQQYPDAALSASDALGPLILTHTDDTNTSDARRTWTAHRDTHGAVVVGFRAVAVEWVLPDGVPDGVRVASSLGDGVREAVVGRPERVLAKAYFAVGELQRWPGWDVQLGEGERPFYVYWIGELPYDSERVSRIAKDMHGAIASFFGDDTSPFRAIHEYALMSPARQYDMWYREGVAQFYAVVAPFTAGAVDRGYFIRWLNNNAQSYYTGGMAGKTWESIIDNYWTSVQNVKAPYGVGFAYLAQVQGLIMQATNGTKDLDDLVLELYRRFTAHEQVQTEEFLEVLSGFVGNEAAEASLSAMLNGTLVVPSADCFAKFGLRMLRKDAELFDIGFVSTQQKVVSFTSNSTRAQEAGLRVGDEIVRMWGAWGASDSLDNMMQVVARRDGREFTVEYWPRSYEKVENWVWEEDDSTVTTRS